MCNLGFLNTGYQSLKIECWMHSMCSFFTVGLSIFSLSFSQDMIRKNFFASSARVPQFFGAKSGCT